MEAKAILRNVRISPRKVRRVLGLIRGEKVLHAIGRLEQTQGAAVPVILSVLRSATANADNRGVGDIEELFVKAVYADEGSSLKRIRPRAMGRAGRINKRSSHITVVVGI